MDITCKICGGVTEERIIAFDGTAFGRCPGCDCVSSEFSYADVAALYDAEFLRINETHTGSRKTMLQAVADNCEWFGPHGTDRSFLDVGSCEGCGMEGMAERGWDCWGFDVFEAARRERVTIAPEFRADLFDRQFAAVLAREVVEHVEDWRGFLRELFAATGPGGVCQVQTPRPYRGPNRHSYQRVHLQLFTPAILERALEDAGFVILRAQLKPATQRWLCRRRGQHEEGLPLYCEVCSDELAWLPDHPRGFCARCSQ